MNVSNIEGIQYDAADVEVKRVITFFSDAIITSFNKK